VPEILEVEAYRALAERTVGRRVARVLAPDPWFCKEGATPASLTAALTGAVIVGARRRGKLLLLDTDGPTLGLRFGMTGRLLVDGVAGMEPLLHSPDRTDGSDDHAVWDRFALGLSGRGRLVVRDPRRLGGVLLDPVEDRLGPDALSITRARLAAALDRGAPLKAVLMDQTRVAGLGNLLTDELLWRAGLDPGRPARSLTPAEVATLHRTLRQVLRTLGRRGGSHTGDLGPHRVPGGVCPREGAPLQRRTIGGRTTFSCPAHQI
jgi:formamidopyrimidine-DNA glycosylase